MSNIQVNPFHRLRKRSHLPDHRKLSPEAIVTIMIHSIYQFGGSMAGVFMNLYLWRLTQDIHVNAMYSLVNYIITPFAMMLAGRIAKTKDRLLVYRLGILFTVLFYLLVLIAREQVVDYMYIFAILSGFTGGFYWCGYLTLMYDVSTNENRIRYLGMNSIFFNLAGLIGPALAGFLIAQNSGLSGYIIVFSIAFAMFLFTAIGSLRLKSVPTKHHKYYLHLIPTLMRKEKLWTKSLIGWTIIGLLQGIMLFLPNILLLNALDAEDMVGYISIIFTSVVVVTSYMLGRIGRDDMTRKLLIVAGIGLSLSSLLLFISTSLWAVLLFMCLYSIFNPIQGNTYSAYMYRIIGQLPLKENIRVETIAMRESFLNLGRAISIVFFIFLANDLEGPVIAWIICIASIMQLVVIPLVRQERKAPLEQEA